MKPTLFAVIALLIFSPSAFAVYRGPAPTLPTVIEVSTPGPQGPAGAVQYKPRGNWSAYQNYSTNHQVNYNGTSYVALRPTTGVIPVEGTDWTVLAAKGDQGLQGAKGDKGDKGEQGLIGPSGPQGPVGPKGDKGDKGDRGDSGAQGIQGLTGPTGAAGPQGPKGDIGPAGPAGPSGPQGPAGPQGLQGVQGPQGPQGTAGGSTNWRGTWSSLTTYLYNDAVAYNGSSYIALATTVNVTPGTDGTKWSLLAAKGDLGPAGPQGATGPVGPQGPTGATGPPGPTGPPGVTGLQGPVGASVIWRGAWSSVTNYVANDAVTYSGSSYNALQASTNVAPGTNGAIWMVIAAKGSDGAQGPQGVQGPTGPTGPQGATGATGATGPAGPNSISSSTASSFAAGTVLKSNGSTVAASGSSDITGALGFTPLDKTGNLSDLSDVATARTNLGLGTAATRNVGTTSGTVAAGDDSRIVNALQPVTGATLNSSSSTTQAAIELSKTNTPSSDRQGTIHAIYNRNGGTGGASANWFEYAISGPSNSGFDIASTHIARADNMNGGTVGAQWWVSAGPNTNTGNWAVYGGEINPFNAYSDMGYQENVYAAPKPTSGLFMVPESELNVGRAAGVSMSLCTGSGVPYPCCTGTGTGTCTSERGYNATYGISFGRSIGVEDAGSGRNYPSAHWWVPITINKDAIAAGGTGILLRGGASAGTAPGKGIKFFDNIGDGIDFSNATFSGSAIRLAPGQTFTDGTVTKSLADLAAGGGGAMVYPSAGVPNSTGSAWGTSYAVGTGANDLLQQDANGGISLNGLDWTAGAGTVSASGSSVLTANTAGSFSVLRAGASIKLSSGTITEVLSVTDSSHVVLAQNTNSSALTWSYKNPLVTVSSNGADVLYAKGTPVIDLKGDSGTQPKIYIHGIGNAANITGMRGNGTFASTTATALNDVMFALLGGGYDGTNWVTSGSIQIKAAEAWGTASNGSYLAFNTAATGSNTTSERMRINASGGVGIGTTTDPGAGNLSVSGSITAGSIPSPGPIGGATPAAITGTTITATTSITAPNMPLSGTYTPTCTVGTNVQSCTGYDLLYIKTGSIVTASGMVQITPSASGVITHFTLSLPGMGANNFSQASQGGGAGIMQGASSIIPVLVQPYPGIKEAYFTYYPLDTTTRYINFSFQYIVP